MPGPTWPQTWPVSARACLGSAHTLSTLARPGRGFQQLAASHLISISSISDQILSISDNFLSKSDKFLSTSDTRRSE